MSRNFWLVVAAIIVVFVGIFAFTGHKSSGSDSKSSSSSSVKPTEHVTGTSTTGVTLVEYGDFECPYCEEYSSVVKQIVNEYSSKITFQFRNFPLTSIHPNAFAAARAAEAAAMQGTTAYWQYHDELYTAANWQVWSTASDPTPYFTQYATDLKLNVAQFKKDFTSDKTNDLVNADLAAGNKLNIQGTPTFYLDGKETSFNIDAKDFESKINAAIADKAKTSAKND